MDSKVSLEQPLVTVAVVFRERYSCASRSLQSILQNRDYPFFLHYFDSNSPPSVRRDLQEAQSRGELKLFSAVNSAPNQLRNQAMATVETKYVCFIDNDVLVTKGWIEILVSTAERTGAGIVFPLYLMGEFAADRIHMAGGKNHFSHHDGALAYNEEHLLANVPASQVMGSLQEGDSDYGEFHCMLLSMEMLQEVGPLDDNYLQVNEHIDIAMLARRAGYRVTFQPRSLVSYVYAHELSPYWLCDIEPFRNRWSHEQTIQDLAHFSRKWNLHSLQAQDLTRFLNRQINSMEKVLPESGEALPVAEPSSDNYVYPYIHSFPRLVRQCLEKGHSKQEITELNTAFDLAAELHGSSLRASKKTFQEHLIRTSSILAFHGAPFDLVKAGLLHAVYLDNTSSNMHLACTEQYRSLLRDLVGKKVEAIVHAYFLASRTCTEGAGPGHAEVKEMPIVQAQAAVVRIANDIEDLLDHAAILERKSLNHFARVLTFQGPVASACGYTAMVEEFGVRIRIAEAAKKAESDNSVESEWMIQLLHDRPPYPLLKSRSLEVHSPSRKLAARVWRKLPRRFVPFRLKVAARRALHHFGLV